MNRLHTQIAHDIQVETRGAVSSPRRTTPRRSCWPSSSGSTSRCSRPG
ncbi:hypothetical protein ACFQ0M_49885 [Kitasatospora aburaviensis]